MRLRRKRKRTEVEHGPLCEASKHFEQDGSIVVCCRFHEGPFGKMLSAEGLETNIERLHAFLRPDGTFDLRGDEAHEVDLISNKRVQRILFAANDLLASIMLSEERCPDDVLLAAANLEQRVTESQRD